MITLITPGCHAELLDDLDWIFEVKFDGFRAAADTVRALRFAARTKILANPPRLGGRCTQGSIELSLVTDVGKCDTRCPKK
jgi:hypothetical protein